ncbi:hypothetical protein AB0K51_30895 [Kitasatospora sp. NPDC049285]|uniref:hypothetical protein n=1 Tax=Kitasatospora sp. NPDC049285 TaxID=3157096 RepID=UPI003446AA5C
MDRNQQAGEAGTGGGSAVGYRLPAVAWAVEADQPAVAPAEAPTAVQPAVRTGVLTDGQDQALTQGQGDGAARGAVPALPGEAAAQQQTEVLGLPVAVPDTGETAVGRPGRISRPMIAAAATAGVVLMGLPLIISHLGGKGPGPSLPPVPPPGFTQQGGGPDGFVPGFDNHGSAAAAGAGAGLVVASPTASPTQTPAEQPAAQPDTQADGQGAAPGRPAAKPTHAAGGGGAAPAPAAPPAAPPAPATYQGLTGPWCANAGTDFLNYNWFDEGQTGWNVGAGGGWTADNCHGKFVAMPMSGDADQDMDSAMEWTFTTGQVHSGSCRISVYIPNSSDVKLVGGTAAYYTVQNQFARGAGTTGSFTIDQTAHRGAWVDSGSFPVTNGQLAVVLHDRGLDWSGTTKTYAHLAASALRVNCTAD